MGDTCKKLDSSMNTEKRSWIYMDAMYSFSPTQWQYEYMMIILAVWQVSVPVDAGLICMTSPFTRCSITVDNNSTTCPKKYEKVWQLLRWITRYFCIRYYHSTKTTEANVVERKKIDGISDNNFINDSIQIKKRVLTSKFLSLAREMDALESKKSPPRIASLFPKAWLTEGTPLRVAA